ncbi:MAG TPA: 2-hydroxyacyl-CoA dehydratase family protein [Bryobacteraceae bacterium]|nr:2-hydroxyacyl-CoA dehydratase family protein [Bryobacteraceae bacterium]
MSSLDSNAAYARLKHAYENPLETALEKHRAGIPVAGCTSNTVPWELLRAGGFFPVLLQSHATETPHADAYMEPVFSQRMRSLLEGLLSGTWSFLKILVIPRTSEQEHKLYLYVSEVIRQGAGSGVPEPYLYNLLHTRSARSRAYGVAETLRLAARLAEIGGRKASQEDLLRAVNESNVARGAIRRLLRLRRGKNLRLSGGEAVRAIGAWYFMDHGDYTATVDALVPALSRRPPLEGPRILIQGAPLDHPALQEAIESEGAVVTAEDDWWNSRAAGRDIRSGSDPLQAIFEKYYRDAPSPRTFPHSAAERWFRAAALRDIEGVVFYLPPEDDVLGWDYPRLRRWLEERGVPSLLVRDGARNLPEKARQWIAEFVSNLRRTRGNR